MSDSIERTVNDQDAGRTSRRQLVTRLGALLALSTGDGDLLGAKDSKVSVPRMSDRERSDCTFSGPTRS